MDDSQPCSQIIRQNFSQDFNNRLSQANMQWMEEEDEKEENDDEKMRKELVSAGIIAPSSQESQNYVISPQTMIRMQDLTNQINHLHIATPNSQEIPVSEENNSQSIPLSQNSRDQYFASQNPYDYNYAPLENQDNERAIINVSIMTPPNFTFSQPRTTRRRRRRVRVRRKVHHEEEEEEKEERKREPLNQYQRKKKFREMNRKFGLFASTISPDEIEDGMTMTEIRKKMENFFDIDISNNGAGKLSQFSQFFEHKTKRFGDKWIEIYYKRRK